MVALLAFIDTSKAVEKWLIFPGPVDFCGHA